MRAILRGPARTLDAYMPPKGHIPLSRNLRAYPNCRGIYGWSARDLAHTELSIGYAGIADNWY